MGLSAEHRAGIDAIQTASRDLVKMDLLELHGGNISVRADDGHMLITKHHVNKSVPSPDDIVRTKIEEHREIYRRSDAQAIIHAHGQLTVTLSFFYDEVEPIDENGIMILGRTVPVVAAPKLIGWNLAAEPIGDALAGNKVVIEKWHGTFAKGVDLVDALHKTRSMEFSAGQIIRVAQLRGVMPNEPTFPPTEVAEYLGGVYRPGIRRNIL